MKLNTYHFIHLALPVINESCFLPATLDCIKKQTFKKFKVYICVNQPESFRHNPAKKNIFDDNQKTISELKKINDLPIEIIDRSSKGLGWENEKMGVGWARKTLMDRINSEADINDVIISLDADTTFNEYYFESVISNFNAFPKAVGMAVPYYHPLVNDEKTNRAMLRYEIYMRNYVIHLWRIGCPYSFTALGSAIAFPIWAYRKSGGIAPKMSGEDFYFLQNLKKCGNLLFHNQEKVFPGTRFSDRVFFGTGPAMIKGNTGDWFSYPIYHYSLFDQIKKTYDHFPTLFETDVETPMSDFLFEQFKTKNIWQPLRKNFKDLPHFIKACHDKIDGLRILQFLKLNQQLLNKTDDLCLFENFKTFFPEYKLNDSPNFFNNTSIDELNELRNFLVEQETNFQKTNPFK